jgi:putative acetyltransferase
VHVRSELPEDQLAVRRVQTAAFGDRGPAVADLVDDLRQLVTNTEGLSLVAEQAGEVVGHALFTPSWLDAPRRLVTVGVLSPLAVAPEHQGRGVGSALVTAGLKMLADRGAPAVFLEGDPRYYSRFGFHAGGDLGFRRPSLRIPERGFQVNLLPAYESWMVGTLVYSEVFWRHDMVGLRL